MKVSQAVASRKSVRGFLPQAVAPDTIRRVLEAAARAPSGGNLQPWHIHVVGGEALEGLRAIMRERIAQAPAGEAREYDVYPRELVSPYRDRRFQVGEALYHYLDIPREDKRGGWRSLPTTSPSSVRRWRCSAPWTAAWARHNGRTWACTCRQ